jgi:hypothetical protein
MKINPFLTLISLLLAVLVSYALYSYCENEELKWMITLLGGVSIFLTWAGTLAISLPSKGSNVNFKVLGSLVAIIMTGLQVFFTFSAVTLPTYTLITGVLLILWLVIAYAIAK